MRKFIAAMFALAILSVGLAPSAHAGNPYPACSYGDYFANYYSGGYQYRSTPIQTVGSQAGKAWCVGFGMWVFPGSWTYNQRNYEFWNDRH